jgi:hypothetical protein
MQLLSPSGLGALSMFEPADGKVPEFDIIDLNLTPRVTLAASDASTGNPFEVVRIRGANGIDRAEMDSGVSGPNGKVVTLDAFGAQTGILGGP